MEKSRLFVDFLNMPKKERDTLSSAVQKELRLLTKVVTCLIGQERPTRKIYEDLEKRLRNTAEPERLSIGYTFGEGLSSPGEGYSSAYEGYLTGGERFLSWQEYSEKTLFSSVEELHFRELMGRPGFSNLRVFERPLVSIQFQDWKIDFNEVWHDFFLYLREPHLKRSRLAMCYWPECSQWFFMHKNTYMQRYCSNKCRMHGKRKPEEISHADHLPLDPRGNRKRKRAAKSTKEKPREK